MDAALQRRIQRYGWDKAADFYTTSWQHQLKPAQNRLMEMAQLKSGEQVIDIACGSGLVSFPAAEIVGTQGFVLGTDLSDHMVSISENIAKEREIKNIRFQQMDAEVLQVDENNFDVALCSLGLMYVPDPLKALKEMYRVVKPGGRAVAAVWRQRSRCGWADIFEIVDRRVSSEVCLMFFNLGNSDILKQHFSKAGFDSMEMIRLNSFLEYDSADEACKAAFLGGPVALAYHKFSEPVKEEANLEYAEALAPFKNGRGYKITGEFVIVLGYKSQD